jgi:hypothetical protein
LLASHRSGVSSAERRDWAPVNGIQRSIGR